MKIRKASLPGWAWDMIAAEERRHGLPELLVNWRVWRGPGNLQTSGVAQPGQHRIGITAGTDEPDQRVMLLHEIGHIVVGPGHGHDDVWRAVVDELWARYGVTKQAAQHEQLVKMLNDPEVRRRVLETLSSRSEPFDF